MATVFPATFQAEAKPQFAAKGSGVATRPWENDRTAPPLKAVPSNLGTSISPRHFPKEDNVLRATNPARIGSNLLLRRAAKATGTTAVMQKHRDLRAKMFGTAESGWEAGLSQKHKCVINPLSKMKKAWDIGFFILLAVVSGCTS